MKKNILLACSFLILLVSCNSSNEDPAVNQTANFSFNGNVYNLLPQNGIAKTVTQNVFNLNGYSYNRNTITITGLNGFTVAALSFDLYVREGQAIAGTFPIYDSQSDDTSSFDEYLTPLDRACLGWTSSASTGQFSCNNPLGSIKIIENNAQNYTIQFSNNFRTYNSDFIVQSNIPAVINITGNVTTF